MPKSILKSLALTTVLSTNLFASDLTVTVTNLNNDKGQVLVALFNSSEDFPSAEGKYKGAKIKPLSGNTASTIFNDIPPGKYAVISYHDENDDGKLDKNFWGKPTEQFGFSNDAQPSMGPPSFKEAQISLSKGESKTIAIKLNDN
jgi:uncharacterized protein (DUF2141 family)